MFFVFTVVLLSFYLTLAFVPPKVLYRRPALVLYSRCNALFQGFLVIAAILVYKDQRWSLCSSSVFALLVVGILQPVVIFKTLQLDSQYWQGRLVPCDCILLLTKCSQSSYACSLWRFSNAHGVSGWIIHRLAGKHETMAAEVFGGIWDEVDMNTAASISTGK
jgi:hypothetical protein